jgi:hypothetical protein
MQAVKYTKHVQACSEKQLAALFGFSACSLCDVNSLQACLIAQLRSLIFTRTPYRVSSVFLKHRVPQNIEKSREFLFGNWEHWSNLRVLTTGVPWDMKNLGAPPRQKV